MPEYEVKLPGANSWRAMLLLLVPEPRDRFHSTAHKLPNFVFEIFGDDEFKMRLIFVIDEEYEASHA